MADDDPAAPNAWRYPRVIVPEEIDKMREITTIAMPETRTLPAHVGATPEFVKRPHHASLWTSILSWAARVGSDSRTVTPVSAGAHG